MANKTIYAAGGIVVRNGARPLIAVVQRSKDDRWVLPRGKLKSTERPVIGARREVVEETGHRVKVREFLGAITYRARGRPKVVQFWRMQAAVRPSHDLMKDIAAVEWLSLAAAIRRLSYPLERLFLRSVARLVIPRRKRAVRRKHRAARRKTKTKGKRKTKPRPATRKARIKKSAAAKLNARIPAAVPAAVIKPASQTVSTPAERRSMLQRVLQSLGR